METSPVNTILHQWHFDPEFSDGDGAARPLPFEGPGSFSALVARYGGDIPPGAMRAALEKIGVLVSDASALLRPSLLYHYARVFDDDFVRRLAFALASLGSTLAHNAVVHQRADVSNERKRVLGRLERAAWSEHLTREATLEFKEWVDKAAPRFLEDANKQIAERELPRTSWPANPPRAVGIGVYFFEED